ncbi:MAG TPA: DNA polymerase IV [Thermomicrobiaceae bacterium]|nr:DNA polymerase IV [Thermomicrobiaceae bacterium]
MAAERGCEPERNQVQEHGYESAPWPRVIIHADLDAFFASAELRRRPELRGQPVIVGGQPGGRGVVASASYEARACGVRSAMPVGQALRLCPEATCLSPDSAYYRQLARRFHALLARFSPLVEIASIDEAVLDLSHSERAFGPPRQVAGAIKRAVRDELDLTVSLGVAGNRLVAKIAADLDKPDGLRLVAPGSEAAFLAPLPVERLPGIGPKAGERLHQMGVDTLGALATLPLSLLQPLFGRRAEEIVLRARGVDERLVAAADEPAEPGSVGHERTFPRDLVAVGEIDAALDDLAARTGRELRRRGLQAEAVAVKLRYGDFETTSRQRRLPPTDDHRHIAAVARELTEAILSRRRAPVRLLGVRVAARGPAVLQLALFDDPLRRRRLDGLLDELTERYGPQVIRSGRTGTRASKRQRPMEEERRVS